MSRGAPRRGVGKGSSDPTVSITVTIFILSSHIMSGEDVPISRKNTSYVGLRPAPLPWMHIGQA